MYTLQELKRMNCTTHKPDRIVLPYVSYSPDTKFQIYPTWNADLHGRYYAAIRADRIITSTLKEKYNLM